MLWSATRGMINKVAIDNTQGIKGVNNSTMPLGQTRRSASYQTLAFRGCRDLLMAFNGLAGLGNA